MSSETFQVYRHSGKFGIHGPVLGIVTAVAVGFPLGYAYSYLIKWIPIIYLNFFLTLGYGFVFGFLNGLLMKFGKVRNTPVAAFCGFLAGIIALYFNWNGHIHAMFQDAPVFCLPQQILSGMRYLYEEGSWGLRGGDSLTGVPLAIVWVVEGLMIVGVSTFVTLGMIAKTPFCEKTQCWLDEEKKINTLAAFVDPAHLAAFRAGDLGPLSQARPKIPASATFGRLTLKHSPKCDEFCTVSIANVTQTTDRDGSTKETVEELSRDLILPKSMLDLIAKFEKFSASTPATAV